jgi:hypothetical protein
MSTIAETKLADLIEARRITHTGHAPADDADAIFRAAGPGELLDVVEVDAEGYPQRDEAWDGIRYSDGSLLLGTYVRGRRTTWFWKAVPNLADFAIWARHGTQAGG